MAYDNDKLPRGSYFYLKIGNRYYGGEQAIKEVVNQYFNRIVDNKPAYDFHRTGKYNDLNDYQSQKSIKIKGFQTVLVDSEDKAKKFRRRKQAENVCIKLKRLYNMVSTTVEIHEV